MKLQQAKQSIVSQEKELAEIRDKGYKTVRFQGREMTIEERTDLFNKAKAGVWRRTEGRRTICDVK